ncbi:MAG TPA: glycosyltransferase family 39 protein, partial [Acidimicrobiales bacterium]|nr:glycosyltransferase family 39 protein [Acidimicrobiales bacterium]
LPLHELPNALKHDGAPPLYYVLLHYWMGLFGQSNDAVRALSGVFAVLTLPVGWLCGKRFGGRAVAWTLVVLLASAPFDVYFGTESRMYSMVILLTGLGFLALERAVRDPRPGNLVGVALVTTALLYSQYWSVYLVAMVAVWLVASIWRNRRGGRPEEAPWAALVALGAGVLLFVPWVPTFLYQAQHTGTPWAPSANFSAVINALTGFTDNQGSTLQTGTNQGRLLAVIYFAMLALAVFGVGESGRYIELDLRTRPRSRGVAFVVFATLFAALAGGLITSSAVSSRYAAVVFLPFLILVAYGTTTLLNVKTRVIIVGLAVAAGLVSSAQNVTTQRTQASAVAAAINAQAKPGDVVAFCPDQLGPSVYRQIENPSQYDMITFPRETGPAIVNWVDYAQTVGAADPDHFADVVTQRAGVDHHVWLVWQPMYQTFGVKCELIVGDLATAAAKSGGSSRTIVTGHIHLFDEPMNLTEYAFGA